MKQIITVLFTVLILTACGQSTQTSQGGAGEEKLQVMTTLFPLKDFTERIGGEHVEVESVLPPGVDAHSFEPTPKTMISLAESDLFIYNGAGLEGFADSAVKTLKNDDVKILEATNGIDLQAFSHEDHDHANEHNDDHHEEADHESHESKENSEHEHSESEGEHPEGEENKEDDHKHGDIDHHVWLDPILAIELAENIKNQLIEIKPERKEEFEKNFEKLQADLIELDQTFQKTIEAADKKEILVSHSAYGYWESRYGIEQLSVSGLSPTNEPTQKQTKKLLEESKAHDIQYILFEQNVNTKPANAIKNQLDLDILYLHNLSVLTEEDISKKEDYFSLMERNIKTLEKALNN
ncbi:metal ABC transporter solute-binding protein, Zn/Mn family [Alkalihalobacillus sp. TS-13]|uniref:metal ABC transporter solute-binding protein, Zn/Mn family n=1 Tax=Alkalihalobacillus sp. TS-13 TaxID=2842455 RepID=UPI001C873445|nr:zinc ABC transporter substrate-binding protein [Alkalihalobacillus sp. TS-13]